MLIRMLMIGTLALTTAAHAGAGKPAVKGASKVEMSVPVRFRGEWNTVPRDCGTALNDSRLIIGANTIRHYESSGPVRAIVTTGMRELALISELTGEGERWLSLSRYQLDATGNRLTDTTDEAHPIVRHRCGKGTKRK